MERDEVPCEYGGRDAESGVGVVEEHMGIGAAAGNRPGGCCEGERHPGASATEGEQIGDHLL